MSFTAITIPSDVIFCQRDSELHNLKAIFWHYFTRKKGPFQWFGEGGLFAFVFLKLQISLFSSSQTGIAGIYYQQIHFLLH